jgi:hypothetical protein
VHAATRDHLLGQAAKLLADPWPVLTATGYARFFADGDRQAYERPYFARRGRLGAAVLAAALAGPTPERVADIVDGVWLLCEETSWCIPAGELFAQRENSRLPDPARPCVDLFAAETAALPLDGRPLIIDVGVGVYTRQTFGPERYEIWTMQSSWHNVPEVDGFGQAPGPRARGPPGPGPARGRVGRGVDGPGRGLPGWSGDQDLAPDHAAGPRWYRRRRNPHRGLLGDRPLSGTGSGAPDRRPRALSGGFRPGCGPGR